MNAFNRSSTLLGFAVFTNLLPSTFAQAVIGTSVRATPAPTSAAPSAVGTMATAPGSLSTLSSFFATQGPFIQRGRFTLRPRVSYSLLYGDGFLRVPGEPENSTMHTFSVGAALGVGERWTLDYEVERNTYSSRLLFDTTDHNASLSGGFIIGNMTVSVSQSYGSNSPTLVETAGQTREKTHGTYFGALYELGQRSALDVSLVRSAREANPLVRSAAWTGSDWVQWSGTLQLRYKFSDRLDAGVGFQGGYDEIEANPDMSYTEPHVRLTWVVTNKISLSGQVGREYRKAEIAGATRHSHPVYRGSLQYSPLNVTSITVSASRGVSASYFSDQTVRNTGWGITVSQRLAGRFFATAGVSHGSTDYLGTTTFRSAGRADSYRSFNLGLSTYWLQRGSISLSYQRSENTSSSSLFEFSTTMYGLEIGYSF